LVNQKWNGHIGILNPNPKNNKKYRKYDSAPVNTKFFKIKKLVPPTTLTMYAIAAKTKKDPNCVQIKKYNEAWIPFLYCDVLYTNKNEGINKHSYKIKKIKKSEHMVNKYTIKISKLQTKTYLKFFSKN
jgi:hypothetical protein